MKEPRIQLLEDLGVEFGRVEEAHGRRDTRALMSRGARGALPGPRAAFLALAVAALVGGSFAVPGTRAAVEDLTHTFAGWIDGDDGEAPGRALRPDDDAPGWVRESGGSTRLIAETEGVGLYVTRSGSPDGQTTLNFSLGKDSTIVGNSVEGWRTRFDDHAVVVLGPGHTKGGDELDERGRFPLMGVTARSVDSVELRYTTGPPLVAKGLTGGFVLLADSRRPLREIVAYDAIGRELERTDVDVQAPVP